jgi:hypothetical protein
MKQNDCTELNLPEDILLDKPRRTDLGVERIDRTQRTSIAVFLDHIQHPVVIPTRTRTKPLGFPKLRKDLIDLQKLVFKFI